MAWNTNPRRIYLIASVGVLGFLTWYLVRRYSYRKPHSLTKDNVSFEDLEFENVDSSDDEQPEKIDEEGEEDILNSYDKVSEVLTEEEAARLVYLLTDDNKKSAVLTYLANCAAFHESQINLLRVGFAEITLQLLHDKSVSIRRNALILLNNLCQNPNVVKFEGFVTNLFLSVADASFATVDILENTLKVLTNLSVTDKYHNDFVPYISTLFELINVHKAHHVIVLHSWKILVNLSTNLEVLKEILKTEVTLDFTELSPEILLRVLTFFSNATHGIIELNLNSFENSKKLLDYILNSGELRRILKNNLIPYVEDEELLLLIRTLQFNLDKINLMKRRQIERDYEARTKSSFTHAENIVPKSESRSTQQTNTLSVSDENPFPSNAADQDISKIEEFASFDNPDLISVKDVTSNVIEHILEASLRSCDKVGLENDADAHENGEKEVKDCKHSHNKLTSSDTVFMSVEESADNTLETKKESAAGDESSNSVKIDDENEFLAQDNLLNETTMNSTGVSSSIDPETSQHFSDNASAVERDTQSNVFDDSFNSNSSQIDENTDNSVTLSQTSDSACTSAMSEPDSFPSASSSRSIDSFTSAKSTH